MLVHDANRITHRARNKTGTLGLQPRAVVARRARGGLSAPARPDLRLPPACPPTYDGLP